MTSRFMKLESAVEIKKFTATYFAKATKVMKTQRCKETLKLFQGQYGIRKSEALRKSA